MTTPGAQPVGFPPVAPVAYQPVTSFSSYGNQLRGHSATYRSDGKVLYAYTEANPASSSSIYSWRVVIATADTPAAFLTQDDSVTEVTWVQRYTSGSARNGISPIPTLTRRDGDSSIYLMLTWEVNASGTAVTPEWNLSAGSPPDSGCVLLVSTDDGATWSLKSTVRSGWSFELDEFPTCTEIYFVDSSTWFVAVTGRDGGFGDPQDVLTYRSTDSGANWSYVAKAGTSYTNQVGYISRRVAGWDSKISFSFMTTGSSPGTTNHYLVYVASDGTGSITTYDSTVNNAGTLWVNRNSRSLFNVDNKLRYYAIKNNDGVEVYETSTSLPVYTDFDLIFSAYSVTGLVGNNFQADTLQPIGGGWAAWMGLDFVLGVAWSSLFCVQAIGYSTQPITPALGPWNLTTQAIGTSPQPITASIVGSAGVTVQAIGQSGHPMTPGT